MGDRSAKNGSARRANSGVMKIMIAEIIAANTTLFMMRISLKETNVNNTGSDHPSINIENFRL